MANVARRVARFDDGHGHSCTIDVIADSVTGAVSQFSWANTGAALTMTIRQAGQTTRSATVGTGSSTAAVVGSFDATQADLAITWSPS